MGHTLKAERPTLEQQKIELIKQEDELKIQLSKLEDSLLNELAMSHGNILENKSLLLSLEETKLKSDIIAKSLAESQQLQKSLDIEREKYSPISDFGSTLYFVVKDLHRINNMYQFSLKSFLAIFDQSLEVKKESSQTAEMRIKELMVSLQKLVYQYVSRSIFKSDRLSFALYFIRTLYPDYFEPNEWELFTGQFISADAQVNTDIPEWIPGERKTAFKKISEVLPGLVKKLDFHNQDLWLKWIRSPTCETEFKEKISLAQKMLIIQHLRPDRLLSMMTLFCCHYLAIENLSPQTLMLKSLLDHETKPSEPIIFITTPGADPSEEIREFGAKQVGSNKYHEVAMGQGQGELAISLLRDAAKSGHWLCLQNIHLVVNWIPVLQKELMSLNFHENFRLWMITESHLKFPASLLENSLKITVEAPPGVKKNLQRIYDSWSPDYISEGSILRAQSLFTLSWFHSVIQERRNFLPQGWNKFYEFSTADLRSSADIIDKMCKSGKPQWDIIHGLFENAIYGGRIDDLQDILKLDTYLKNYFNDDILSSSGKMATRKLCSSFNLPASNQHDAYKKIIHELPDSDEVTLFGLPANIDRTFQRNASEAIILKLRELVETIIF